MPDQPKTMEEMRQKAAKKALKKGKVVKDARGRNRNYRKEYDEYHGTAEQRKKRSERNKARRKLQLKVGDPREADHKVPMSKGGGNGAGNLRAVSRSTNRKKQNH
tara:strand:- start:605 stop:919 length:315 start_codon:yes stop_codon:yes gene_type:complete